MLLFVVLLFLINYNPMVLGLLFLLLLGFIVFETAIILPWLGFILLLVYVGGLIVLFIYCLSALKLSHYFHISSGSVLALLIGFSRSLYILDIPFDFYSIFRLLIILAISLFLVIVIVVILVDPGLGALKPS